MRFSPTGNQEPRSNHPKSCLADLELLGGRQSGNILLLIPAFHLETKISGRGHSHGSNGTRVALEGNFSQLWRILQGTGGPHCSCVGFLSAIRHLELPGGPASNPRLRAASQIPTLGLREAAEEGRLVTEGAEPWNSFPEGQRAGVWKILWWQVKNPGFTRETQLRWQRDMKEELQTLL